MAPDTKDGNVDCTGTGVPGTTAGAVVGGHVIAILMWHRIALRLFGAQRRAALSQLPIAGFMIAYTRFGLWLLASPQV